MNSWNSSELLRFRVEKWLCHYVPPNLTEKQPINSTIPKHPSTITQNTFTAWRMKNLFLIPNYLLTRFPPAPLCINRQNRWDGSTILICADCRFMCVHIYLAARDTKDAILFGIPIPSRIVSYLSSSVFLSNDRPDVH